MNAQSELGHRPGKYIDVTSPQGDVLALYSSTDTNAGAPEPEKINYVTELRNEA